MAPWCCTLIAQKRLEKIRYSVRRLRESFGSSAGVTPSPVSYTHLDVYKRQLLYRQLGIMLSTLSTMIAVVLAFLILYANQFLLKMCIRDRH